MVKDTSLTKLDCLKGKEILILMRLNLNWAVCFKAEIKPLDFIIDCKFSGRILPSAEARGKIPVEAKAGKRMCAPVDRHI